MTTSRSIGISRSSKLGVLDFEGGGVGRARKPVLSDDGLEIDIQFADSTTDVDAAMP